MRKSARRFRQHQEVPESHVPGNAPMLLGAWTAFTPLEKAILFVGSALCAFACVWIGKLFGIPREPEFNGSLLAAGSPVLGIVVVIIAAVICTAIASMIAAYVETESGLFCCSLGLAALAIRCGSSRPVLQYASGPHVFFLMAVETVLLAGIIYGIWFVLHKIFDRPELASASGIKLVAPNEVTDATLGQKLMVLGVQVVVTAVVEMILVQTDAKAQAMAGLGVAAFLGVLAAYMFMALPQGIWYWGGPMIVGVVGYIVAGLSSPSGPAGDVPGFLAALARPTPLDYAGAGTAGALLAYWCSRRWAQPEAEEAMPAGL